MPASLRVLPLLLVLLLASPSLAQEEGTRDRAATYDWVLFYWMAYDNDLAKCGPPILRMLSKGITNEKVAVVVCADWPGPGGMKRYVLTQGKIGKGSIASEGSADAKNVAAQLAWTKENLPAKKYGLIFLNHGGALGQMSIDEHPEGTKAPSPEEAKGKKKRRKKPGKWMFPPNLATACNAWRKDVEGEVELFFFQQCGKGSLENYHVMKDTARYVMGSQTVVGAPNAYYEATLKWLCETPSADGLALAKKITETEIPQMFTTYTTVDSAQLQKLQAKLEPVLAPLAAKGEELVFPPMGGKVRHCFDFSKREFFFDGLALLEATYDANGIDKAPYEAFAKWSNESLVVSHRVSPLQKKKASTWCGYSLLLPFGDRVTNYYAKGYPLYSETKVPAVFGQLGKDLLRKVAAARRKAIQERRKRAAERKRAKQGEGAK